MDAFCALKSISDFSYGIKIEVIYRILGAVYEGQFNYWMPEVSFVSFSASYLPESLPNIKVNH